MSAETPRPADSIARNAVFALATQMTTAALTAGLTIFLGRALNPTNYGHFAIAMSVGGIALVASDLGLRSSTARFVAEARGREGAVASVLGHALRLKVVIAGVVCVLLFALASPLAELLNAPGAAWAIRATAIATFGQGLMLVLLSVFEALGRIAVSLRVVTSESLVEVGASVALVLAGGGASGAAFGRATGYTVGVAVAFALLIRAIGRPRRGAAADGVELAGPRAIAKYAGALLIVDVFFQVFAQIDILLIAVIIGGGSAAAIFQLPMAIAWFLHYPFGAMASAIAPRLARDGGGEPRVDAFLRGCRYIVILQGVFLAPFLVWAEPIIRLLLGPKYDGSAAVLRALMPFVVLSGPAVLVSLSVNYLGEARRRVPLAAAVLAINVIADIILLPSIGVVGGAIATDLAYLVWVPGHLLIMRSLLDIPLRPLLLPLVRSTVAAAAMAGLLLLLGTGQIGNPLLFAGLAAGSLVYVLVLRLTGELTPADLAEARALLRRFTRRTRGA